MIRIIWCDCILSPDLMPVDLTMGCSTSPDPGAVNPKISASRFGPHDLPSLRDGRLKIRQRLSHSAGWDRRAESAFRTWRLATRLFKLVTSQGSEGTDREMVVGGAALHRPSCGRGVETPLLNWSSMLAPHVCSGVDQVQQELIANEPC